MTKAHSVWPMNIHYVGAPLPSDLLQPLLQQSSHKSGESDVIPHDELNS